MSFSPLRGVAGIAAAAAAAPTPSSRMLLQAQFSSAKVELESLLSNNVITNELIEWFSTALASLATVRDSDVDILRNAYLEQLKRYIESENMREICLGTDGKIYNRQAYELFLREAPPGYRNRSPSNPEDRSPFTVKRHPALVCIRNFLIRMGQEVAPNTAEEEFFERLPALQGPPPPSPEERLQALLRNRAATREQRAKALADYEASLQERITTIAVPLLAAQANIARNREETDRRLAALEARVEEDEESFKARIELLGAKLQNLIQEREKLDEETEQLKQENAALRQENAELRAAIRATEEKIKKNRDDAVIEVCIVVGTIVACVIATKVILAMKTAAAAGAAGSSVAIAPASTTTMGGVLTRGGEMIGGKTLSSTGVFAGFSIPI